MPSRLSAKALFNRLVADRALAKFDVLRCSAHAHHRLRIYVMSGLREQIRREGKQPIRVHDES